MSETTAEKFYHEKVAMAFPLAEDIKDDGLESHRSDYEAFFSRGIQFHENYKYYLDDDKSKMAMKIAEIKVAEGKSIRSVVCSKWYFIPSWLHQKLHPEQYAQSTEQDSDN